MSKLEEIREKYPQYKDIDDNTLMQGVYKKHYEGKMSYEDFSVKMLGTIQPAPATEQPKMPDVAPAKNRINKALDGIQMAGQSRITLGKTAGNAQKTLIKEMFGIDISKNNITPTFELVTEWAGEKLAPIANTPIGQKLIRAIASGGEAIESFRMAYPHQFDMAETLALTSGMTAGRVSTAPHPGYWQGAGRMPKQPKGDKWLESLMMRYQNKPEQISQTGRTAQTPRGTNIIALDREQKAILEVIKDIPGVKEAEKFQSVQRAKNAISTATRNESLKYRASLKQAKINVHRGEVQQSIKQVMDDLWETPDFYGINRGLGGKIEMQISKLYKNQPQTVEGLDKARVALDHLINNRGKALQKAGKMASGAQQRVTPTDMAYVAARGALNDLLDLKVGTNVAAKTSRHKMSMMLKADEILQPKAAYEKKYFLERYFDQRIKPFVPFTGTAKKALIPAQK